MARYKPYWRVNEGIHAPKVRVIDEKGKQLGVLDISKALDLSKKATLDLVEIAPKAKPPVVKIVEFGKFKYQEGKKLKKQKKGKKGGELKEIRFSPFIGKADYDTRIDRIKKFLEEKDKVRVVVKFKGRQMGSKQFGYNLLRKVLATFKETVAVDMEPKFLGRHLMMVISPVGNIKKSVNVEKNKEPVIESKVKNAKTKN